MLTFSVDPLLPQCLPQFACKFTQDGPAYRGIDVVRNKIKMFAQKKVTLPPGRHKIIILDEADRYSMLFLH